MATSPTARAARDEGAGDRNPRADRDPLEGIPEALQIHLGEALDWMENRTESFDGGVRLTVGSESVELREWTARDLTSCFEVEEPEALPYREAVTCLCLVLKARESLELLEQDTSATEDLESVRSDLGLFDTVAERVQKAIDAAVLRGSLVGARNLSRIRDLTGSFRRRLVSALEETEKARRKARRSALKGTGKEFRTPAEKVTPPRAPKIRPRSKASTRSKPESAAGKRKAAAKTGTRGKQATLAIPDTTPYRFPWLSCAVVVMALSYWCLGIYTETRVNREPALDRQAWERILPLQETFTAGGVLYATIGEEWGQIPYRDRIERFRRLQERASLAGYQGVVLTNPAGDFTARWSEGSPPQVWTR